MRFLNEKGFDLELMQETFDAVGQLVFDAKLNVATDDCSRVLITSRGHVTAAPTVPATL